MKILEYFFNEDTGDLHIDFSTKEDKNNFYRSLILTKIDIEYYSPIIYEDPSDIDKFFIVEILVEYFKENDLPEQLVL